jgi:cytochrome P450
MSTFFLAMTIHPEVQRKAREEIDRVVGTHRLPTFSDRENLPYVEAVVKESFRWHPIGPMGLPHVASQDDIYGEYLIPKGAMMIPNIWWFTHDPKVYPEPSTFNPDRYFADPAPPSPTNYIFGFGRRICPGRLLAESSVWLTIAKSLAALDIRKGIDQNGKEIEPTVDFLPGIISHPVPFKAAIKPRSPEHEELIRAVESDHPWEESSAKALESIEL